MSVDERRPLLAMKAIGGRLKTEEKTWNSGTRRIRFIEKFFSVSGICLLGCISIYITYLQVTITTPNPPFRKGSTSGFNYTCLPTQSCWPSSSEWVGFNKSINGNLRLTVPWAQPCYTGSLTECQNVAGKYMNGASRSSQYGAMEFLDWEVCGQSNCMLNSFAPSLVHNSTCSLGRLSTYHVEAHTSNDIQNTLKFIKKHGIRLSIKNSGHDYFGRSSTADSLAIWTRKMTKIRYHKTFRPMACQPRYENVGEIEAGVSAQEAWEFFEPLNFHVTVGAVSSVGIAGGFGQGGGHGPLGPTHGLMVDNAIEFDVVTADGQPRTINACNEPDLFWAMRGGGGGTFAVLTSYKFQLHPAVPLNVYSLQASFPTLNNHLNISESAAHRDTIRALASNQAVFAAHGIAGYNFILPDHIVSLQIHPSADTEYIKKVTSSLREYITTHKALNITENAYYTFPRFSEWHKFTEQPAIARNGPVGLGLAESGRFLPKRLFSTSESIERVVDAVVDSMQFSFEKGTGGAAQLYATGPLNHPDNSKTGVNPAWRDAMWEVIMGGVWTSETPESIRDHIRNTISASIGPYKALTPGGGCYMNEGDWSEEDWQQTFFGSNYGRLLQVKRRYDPTGLFNCWKCVGWNGYHDPMQSCCLQNANHTTTTIPLGLA